MQYRPTPVLVLALLGLASASPRNNIKEPVHPIANATTSDTTATASATYAVGTGVSVNGTMANCSTSAAPPASTITPVTTLNTTTPASPSNTTVPVTGDAKDLNAPMGTVCLGMGLLAAAGYLAVL